ncbi:hypothetical protein M758_11G065800 [Ceratodon purpureus]|uniref:Uncharacterized protein n=1 Tax=Ceratodon purpureus TaxID=3225 RepID=A0A8T0GBZ2_CERPU|nr:hypothetical protein KC19_11G067600 [Ceratodon purpureus]KAG0600849.1 hypothetical protein M758_11G065800 [Ceratodon purpureus]
MAEKKASVVAEKKASIVAGKKVSVAVAAAEALGVTGDPTSALNLTPEEALAAEQAQERMDIRAMPVRQYLEKSVVPLLLHGLQLLAIERYVYEHSLLVQQVRCVRSLINHSVHRLCSLALLHTDSLQCSLLC